MSEQKPQSQHPLEQEINKFNALTSRRNFLRTLVLGGSGLAINNAVGSAIRPIQQLNQLADFAQRVNPVLDQDSVDSEFDPNEFVPREIRYSAGLSEEIIQRLMPENLDLNCNRLPLTSTEPLPTDHFILEHFNENLWGGGYSQYEIMQFSAFYLGFTDLDDRGVRRLVLMIDDPETETRTFWGLGEGYHDFPGGTQRLPVTDNLSEHLVTPDYFAPGVDELRGYIQDESTRVFIDTLEQELIPGSQVQVRLSLDDDDMLAFAEGFRDGGIFNSNVSVSLGRAISNIVYRPETSIVSS